MGRGTRCPVKPLLPPRRGARTQATPLRRPSMTHWRVGKRNRRKRAPFCAGRQRLALANVFHRSTFRAMSGEPSNFNARAMARWLASRGQAHTKRQQLGPRPTLGQLHRSHCWTWVYCEKCLHHAPMALVPLIIRWGAEASSDQLRQCARCTRCGNKVATLQHPGWAGTHIGFQPFPLPASGS